MPAPDQSLKEIFLAALDVAPGMRAKWLLDICGDDAGLREQLIRMLEAHDTPQSLLDQTSGAIGMAALDVIGEIVNEDDSIGAGTVIGHYKLLQKIGEGGMGTVFMAEQTHPVRRTVAIKVIKPGMDSRLVIARFEAERQTLALMDHANIARVLDAGATEGGRLYFVMELLEGTPITLFCDGRRLTPRQRLELFVPVCQAIQHAHQKGIIHRDIKPSNVLVVMCDDRPVPKVIDFGVAKATGREITEQTINTGFSVIGTPEYMSPEQATLNQLDVDTRSDIYSLGVLLYELLAGSTPFRKQETEKAGLLEFLRVIREEEPPRPSNKADASETLPRIGADRGIEPSKLCDLLRNELDWIVMKALEKDRARRYETINGLIGDINRYLSGEAVLAHPPTWTYRFGKFVRRNKGVLLAASLVFIALLAGVVGTTLGLLDARTHRTLANEQRDRAVEAEKESQARAEELQMVSDFQAGMLEKLDPNRAGVELSSNVKAKFDAALAKAGLTELERNQRVKAFMENWRAVNAADIAGELIERTILKPAIDEIETRFKDQPLVGAQLRQSLAIVYNELGLYEPAVELQTAILKTRRDLQGDEQLDTLRAKHHLGSFLLSQGKLSEAEPFVRESLEKRRQILGNNHIETISSINNLVGLLLDQGKLVQAESLAREAIEAGQLERDGDETTTVTAISNLGMLLWSQGKLQEAESLLRSAQARRSQLLGELHHHTLYSKVNLGGLLSSQEKHHEAEPLLRDALQTSLQLLGTEHPTTIACITGLGSALIEQGNLTEAEPLIRDSYEKCPRLLGDNHKTTLLSISSMGLLLQDLGKLTEAEPIFREGLKKCRRVLGDDHPQTIRAIDRLGSLLWFQGSMTESETLTQEALERSRRVLGEDHPMTLHLLNDAAAAYWSINQLDKSIPIFEDLVKCHEAIFGRANQTTLNYIANLGVNYKDAGRLAEGIPLMEEAYAASSQTPSLNWIGQQLMHAYIADGREDNAKTLAMELVTKARKYFPSESLGLAGELAGCGEVFLRLREWADAERLLRESQTINERLRNDDWRSYYTQAMLGEALLAQDKLDEAQSVLISGYDGMIERISNVSPIHLIRLKDLLERIAQVYATREMPDQAAEWRKRLGNISR
jgi:eukaryotic-like serine/threonine-protein kinase